MSRHTKRWIRQARRHCGSALYGFAGAAMMSVAGGCTSATFDPRDAGESTGDAEAAQLASALDCTDWPSGSSLPEGARALVGRYQVRVDYFDLAHVPLLGVDFYANVHTQTWLLGEIAEAEGGLELSLQICDWESDYTSLGPAFTARATVDHVQSTPLRRLRLSFGPGCSWSAEPIAPAAWGYDPALQSTLCSAASGSAERSKPWLSGAACTCSPDPSAMPEDERDCRVVDADDDGEPGFSTTRQSNLLGDDVHHLAIRTASAFFQGRLDASGVHTALERRVEEIVHLGCAPALTTVSCHDENSRVVMRPLREDGPTEALCEAVIRNSWAEGTADFPTDTCPPPRTF